MARTKPSLTTHEQIYCGAATAGSVSLGLCSSPGLVQFRCYESTGVYPASPHPDFLLFLGGKRGFFYARTQLAQGWHESDERWPGLHSLQLQTPQWALEKLLNWHPAYSKPPAETPPSFRKAKKC